MDRLYSEIQNREQKYFLNAITQLIWTNEQINLSILKKYLELAEKGCPDANQRVADAFENGEFGLPKDTYWENVFRKRPSTYYDMNLEKSSILKQLTKNKLNAEGSKAQSQQDELKSGDAACDSDEATVRSSCDTNEENDDESDNIPLLQAKHQFQPGDNRKSWDTREKTGINKRSAYSTN